MESAGPAAHDPARRRSRHFRSRAGSAAGRIANLARQWRLPDGVPVVMLPGRLTRWKGGLDFIAAIAALGRRDICCLLVGAEQRRGLSPRAGGRRSSGTGSAACFASSSDCRDMPAAYMLADVVVSASTDPEGFGRIIVEAQAMGRPVIATDHGGARETICTGRRPAGWCRARDPAPSRRRSARRCRSGRASERCWRAARGRAYRRPFYA